MIREFERYHGIVFSRLFHSIKGKVSIEIYPSKYNSSYILNEQIGLYIKHSKKRLSPWRFSFLKEHQDEIYQMRKLLKNVFIVLVCHNDGLVVLSYDELKLILDEEYERIEWVSVKRRRREEYSVSGSDGKLKFKIAESDFPGKIFK
jgi:hypothetical protein